MNTLISCMYRLFLTCFGVAPDFFFVFVFDAWLNFWRDFFFAIEQHVQWELTKR